MTKITLKEGFIEDSSKLDSIDNNKLGEFLKKIINKRVNPEADFGVVSMCCGSGRTPEKQHWHIKAFPKDSAEFTFRYKDTVVTYDSEKNNLEFVTFGPGQGREAKTPLDAAIGVNPSIEDIISQQKELYQALNAIRKEMHQNNKVINITPDATIIGFSRGAAAIQKMSGELVKSLPVFVKGENDSVVVGSYIEIDKENSSYSIYNSSEVLVGSGKFSQENLNDYNIDYENRKNFEKNINRFLWSNNVNGYENNILINPDNTAWISLDAVAGRADSEQLNDHYFNNEYCHGLYVMSTRLATEHAILGFGATNPDGDGMKKLSINGKHGAVFDDESLRKTIIDNINTKDKLEERLKKIGDAVEQENNNLLYKSVLGSTGMNLDSNGFSVPLTFEEQIKAKSEETLGKLNEKINEKHSVWTKVGQFLGIGSGQQRVEERHKNFGKIEKEILQFIITENQKREANQLPSLEKYTRAYNNINDKLNKIDEFIQKANNETEKKIALNLLNHLLALIIQTNIDSTKAELKTNLEQAFEWINEAKHALPKSAWFTSSKLAPILETLNEEIGKNIEELGGIGYIELEKEHSGQVPIFKEALASMQNKPILPSEENPDQAPSEENRNQGPSCS